MKKSSTALAALSLALVSACSSEVTPSAHNDAAATDNIRPTTDGEISPSNENAVAGIAAMENAAESVAYNETAETENRQ